MNYYILPKINNTIIVNPIESENKYKLQPYISQSLLKYYNETCSQIKVICDNEAITQTPDKTENTPFSNSLTHDELNKIVNPYEYIFSKVPGSKFSVSKLKPKTNLFYDFLEVCSLINIFEPYKSFTMKTLHITPNHSDTIECFEMMRENYNDEIMCYDEINEETIKSIGDEKFDFLFFECKTDDLKQYTVSLIECIMIILRNQSHQACCIIKIRDVFYKPIVDMLYLLSSLYDRTFILKPVTSNIVTFDKYIVCKSFNTNKDKLMNFKLNYFRLLVFLKKLENKDIISILDYDVPYYYTMKINDMNIISGQQLIDALDLMMNILKNKNREEKIELLKKTNIQKSVAWCEKYRIPCNKFMEKNNIVLPMNKELKEIVEIIDI